MSDKPWDKSPFMFVKRGPSSFDVVMMPDDSKTTSFPGSHEDRKRPMFVCNTANASWALFMVNMLGDKWRAEKTLIETERRLTEEQSQ